MRLTPSTLGTSGRVTIALMLMLAAAGLAVWSPRTGSHAQQDRQLVQPGSTNANIGKRIALVIGNGAYTSAPPLKNPPNDARDMAATLRALGFDVTNGINVNQRDMKRLIREFGQKLRSGGSGLFYYAGHGVQSKGRNYLIPVDAEIQSEAEVEDSGVDVGLVLNFMDDAQNGLNIVILDACRNNPFSRSFRSASNGLAQVDAPTGTLIAYATAPGRVASDGTGQNGLYTSELLKQMRVPGLSATELFMRVRAEVMKQTGNKQVPWEASSLVGSFYFTGTPTNLSLSNSGTNNAAPNETKFDAAAFEYSYWETIKSSTNVEDFKAYLEKYPNGQFAALAKNRIASLDASTKSAADGSPTELAFWDAIKNSTDAEDFKSYLTKYPNGQFADIARRRSSVPATAPSKTVSSKAALNPAVDLSPGSYSYKVKWKVDKESGQYDFRFEIKDAGDWWIVKEVWGRSREEGSEATTIEKGSLLATRLVRKGSMLWDLDVKDDKLLGMITYDNKTRPFSAALDGPLLGNGGGASSIVVAALPLTEGYTANFRYLDLTGDKLQVGYLRVAGSETITVPAGTFAAYRVEMTYGSDETILWIGKESRKVLKMLKPSPLAGRSGSLSIELLP